MSEHPLRIRFFANLAHEQGTYFRFHNLAIALAGLGQTVDVFALDHDTKSRRRREIRDGITYEIIPSAPGLSFVSPLVHPANILRMWCKSTSTVCDVAHLFQPFPAAFAAWRSCRAATRFFDWDGLWIGGLMTGPASGFRSWSEHMMTGFLEKRLPSMADSVTTCSAFLADIARAYAERLVLESRRSRCYSPPGIKKLISMAAQFPDLAEHP